MNDAIYYIKSNAFYYSFYRPVFKNQMHFRKGFFRLHIKNILSDDLFKKLHEYKNPFEFSKLLDMLKQLYAKN